MTEQEIDQAITDNEGLIYFAINRYFPSLRGDEDIVQVGRIGLWKACRDYDDSRSKFSTGATSYIVNEIKTELRRRAKQWSLGNVASLDEPLRLDEDSGGTTLAHFIPDTHNYYCAIDHDVSFLSSKLSKRDLEVFQLSIRGFSAAEIGQVYGFSRSWAAQIIKKAQAIARTAMGHI